MRFNCNNKFLFFQEIFSYFQIRYFLSIPVYNGQSRSRSYNFILAHFLNLEGPFRWVMVFLTSIDPLKSMITVRRKVIFFHQNDDIVHFKSFQSLTRITYASHGNDFLPLNLDHGQTYRYISAVAGLKLLGGPNLHFYCSTLVFNIYFLEFAKLLGGPGPPRPLPTLRHCTCRSVSKKRITI